MAYLSADPETAPLIVRIEYRSARLCRGQHPVSRKAAYSVRAGLSGSGCGHLPSSL
jgi:hypothetical protein